MTVPTLVEQLEALVRDARAIPLTREVRFDREAFDAILDELRSAAALLEPTEARERFVQVVDELDDLVHDARMLPLTDQMRLPRKAVVAGAGRLRAAVPVEA